MTPNPPNLHVLHVDTGREWRGGQGQVFNLCQGLRDAGVSQTLVAPPGSPLAERAACAGIEVAAMRLRGELDLLGARRLGGLADKQGASIIHAHDAHAHALAWMALRKRPGVALAVSRRVDFAISKNFLSRRKYLDPRVQFLAISNGVRDVLVAGGVEPRNIFIVPSGVDPARFGFDVPRERLRREFSIPDGAPVIGTIGALVDHKSHRYLIDAAPEILARYPDARFVLVGDGELRANLESQIADLGLEKSVLLTGHRHDVETFYSGFDVFALSSHLEGLCTSIIDAMLFRLPVAATRTGGVPDLVQDGVTGLLAEPKNPSDLARAILRLLDEPELAARLAEAGRRHALASFTAESLVRNTLEAYQAIPRN